MRVDDALPRARLGAHRRRDRIELRRHAGVLARQIGADLRPVIAAIVGAVDVLVREVEDARIAARERERQCPRACDAGPGTRGWA